MLRVSDPLASSAPLVRHQFVVVLLVVLLAVGGFWVLLSLGPSDVLTVLEWGNAASQYQEATAKAKQTGKQNHVSVPAAPSHVADFLESPANPNQAGLGTIPATIGYTEPKRLESFQTSWTSQGAFRVTPGLKGSETFAAAQPTDAVVSETFADARSKELEGRDERGGKEPLGASENVLGVTKDLRDMENSRNNNTFATEGAKNPTAVVTVVEASGEKTEGVTQDMMGTEPESLEHVKRESRVADAVPMGAPLPYQPGVPGPVPVQRISVQGVPSPTAGTGFSMTMTPAATLAATAPLGGANALPPRAKAATEDPLRNPGTAVAAATAPEAATPVAPPQVTPAPVIPVVQYYEGHLSRASCDSSHYIARTLEQARRHNSLVHLIGPPGCRTLARRLGVHHESTDQYHWIVRRFERNVGDPVNYQVRWFVLEEFMRHHKHKRAFYMDSDVLLFANVTDVGHTLYPLDPVLLSMRWPSLHRLSPGQYPSVAVSGHVALWTHDALMDFLRFFRVFLNLGILSKGDHRAARTHDRRYNDMVVLGWYTYQDCWVLPGDETQPECVGDPVSAITRERAKKLRKKFRPKYSVRSLAEPVWCTETDYSDEGLCVFDHNFSVNTTRRKFKYSPKLGMKTPTSRHYVFFSSWKNQSQTQPVQFLAVHFSGHKKKMIVARKDPSATWGSAQD